MSKNILLVLLLLAILIPSLSAHAADGPMELGLELVPYSRKIGERRYESSRDFDGTLKHFKDMFRGQKQIKWHREVSVPAVKYVHIENTGSKPEWGGINIYALSNGRVRVYVLPRLQPAAAAAVPPATP